MSATYCIKCSGEDIGTTWHNSGQYRSHYRCAGVIKQRTSFPDEHLCYRCRTCGYGWTGPTEDDARSTP